MNIIKYKYFYFLVSLLVVIPGLFSLAFYGLNLSIDFTGGSRITFSFPSQVTDNDKNLVKEKIEAEKIKVYTLEPSGKDLLVRTNPISATTNKKIVSSLQQSVKEIKEPSFETIGPTIGSEITLNAVKAVAMSSLLIVIYISYVFRKVPKPASSIRFGISVVVALFHDVLVVLGVFSILGHFLSVEVDSLFVTALLTVIGFSVHDTIVVFDRIRENLDRSPGENFAKVVNDSILQTLNRSLNTSLTVVLVLLALFLFGGESIKWFVVALLIGVISGTYSSIFNAAPILVVWHEWSLKRRVKS